MQSLTKPKRQFKDALIRRQNKNIPRGVQNRRTDLTVLQMFLDLFQYVWCKCAIEIAGDVLPYMFALYNHGNHLRFGFTCFNCGTNFFCSIIRARWSRTLTDAMLMPSDSADSFTLNSSMSRNKKTSR